MLGHHGGSICPTQGWHQFDITHNGGSLCPTQGWHRPDMIGHHEGSICPTPSMTKTWYDWSPWGFNLSHPRITQTWPHWSLWRPFSSCKCSLRSDLVQVVDRSGNLCSVVLYLLVFSFLIIGKATSSSGPGSPSPDWYKDFVTEADAGVLEHSGKISLLFEILRMAEELGDKVWVLIADLCSV